MTKPYTITVGQLKSNINSLSSAEIDEMIFILALRRNELEPFVPMKIDELEAIPGASIHHQMNPAMAIANHKESDGFRLILRSGGLGWVEFVISQINAIALRDWLLSKYGNKGTSIFSKNISSQNTPI